MPVAVKLILGYAPFIVLIPFVSALFHFRSKSSEMKELFFYLLVANVIELIAGFLWLMKINNLPLLHLYTILEFVLITLIYRKALVDSIPQKVFTCIAILFTVFSVMNSAFIQSIFRYNTYARSTEAIIITTYTLIYFYTLIIRPEPLRLKGNPMVWMNTGFMIYFSCSFFLFILSNSILYVSLSINKLVWAIHAVLILVLYSLITIGIWSKQAT